MTFTIDKRNAMAAFRTPKEATQALGAGAQTFSSLDELRLLTSDWPLARLVAIWNGLAERISGLQPVRKFEQREVALARIWKAIQRLTPPASSEGRPESKTALVLGLLRRPAGATLEELMQATGWQAHSVRGFLSGTLRKKRGLHVVYERDRDGTPRYRVCT